MLPQRFGEDIYDPEFHQYWAEAKEKEVGYDLEGYIPKPQIDFSKLTSEEKNALKVSDSAPFCIYRDIIKIIRREACVSCWLLKRACMCSILKPTYLPKNVHFHFIVHYSEFSRTSNTVKIFVRSVQKAILAEPEKFGTAEMLFFGVESHEEKLLSILRKDSNQTIVLFPSTNPPAITVEQFLKSKVPTYSEQFSSASSDFPTLDDIHVVVIDGTWKQANHIHKRLIDDSCTKFNIPLPIYIKIDPGSILKDNISLFDPLRSQTQPDRCCTLEASVALLKELGCNMGETGDPLLYNLKALVDSQLSQSAIKPIYGIIDELQHKKIALGQHTFPKGTRVCKVDDESLRYVAMTGCSRGTQKRFFNNGKLVDQSKKVQWTKDGKRICEERLLEDQTTKKSKLEI